MTELQNTAADRLHRALYRAGRDVAPDAIQPMPDKGLAHDHWWIDSAPAAVPETVVTPPAYMPFSHPTLIYRAAGYS